MEKKPKNYLFVCHANINRSKTAEDVCKAIAEQRNLKIAVTSAGISSLATNPVTKEIADRADVIFVMEEYMKTELVVGCRQNPGKIICLNIPDIYERGDPALVGILQDVLSTYLKQEEH